MMACANSGFMDDGTMSPVLQIAVVLLLSMVWAIAHLLAQAIVWNGGLIVGAVVIAALLLATPWLSHHLD